MSTEKLMTVNELADYLCVHPQTVYQLIYRKKIPYIKKRGIGYRFRLEDIEEWMSQDQHSPAGGSLIQNRG